MPIPTTLEVQDLKKNVLMKIRTKWVKKVRPCKILMMYHDVPFEVLDLKSNIAINILLM